ncbi:hypothetical protein D9M71_652920 [compost metagenome]
MAEQLDCLLLAVVDDLGAFRWSIHRAYLPWSYHSRTYRWRSGCTYIGDDTVDVSIWWFGTEG